MKHKHLLIVILSCLVLTLLLSTGVSAAKKAAASTWTIAEYGEKAWNAYNTEMTAFDASAATADTISLNGTAALLIEAESGKKAL